MTAITLAPVHANSQAAPQEGEKKKYSDYDNRTIADYVTKLDELRYFKVFNAKSPQPRIICAEAPADELPMSWLSADFVEYCKEAGRRLPKPMPDHDYIGFGLPSVNGTCFVPRGPAIVKPFRTRHKYTNTYRCFEPMNPAIPLADCFHKFFECWFPDPVERHIFLQYIGHMFQHPEVRPSWHFMILSETGTGKGFLYKAILNPLLCYQTQQLKKFTELTGRFSNAMKGTILVVLDDCMARRADQQEQLKSLMTEERILLEEKGLAAGMVTTYSRFIFFTNEDVPLDLDESERRWCIPKRLSYSHGLTGDEGRKDRLANVIQPLADWIKQSGALEAVYKFFMEYDLVGFNPNSPPMTETLREQIAKSVTPEMAFASDFLREHPIQILKLEDLVCAFTDAGMNRPGNQAVSRLLKDCEYHPDYLTVEGKRTRWWFPSSMSATEAEAILTKEKAAGAEKQPF